MYASLLHVYVHSIDYGLVSVYSSILYHSYPQWGQTALHMASRAGQTAVVKELLDHGANVHAVTKVGRFGVLLDCSVRGIHHVLYILDTYVSVLMAPYYLISITVPADCSPYGQWERWSRDCAAVAGEGSRSQQTGLGECCVHLMMCRVAAVCAHVTWESCTAFVVITCGGDMYKTVTLTQHTACLCVGSLLIAAVHSLPMIPHHYTAGEDSYNGGCLGRPYPYSGGSDKRRSWYQYSRQGKLKFPQMYMYCMLLVASFPALPHLRVCWTRQERDCDQKNGTWGRCKMSWHLGEGPVFAFR